MTIHYKIHIKSYNTNLRVSYRNGKFFKVEKLTGKLTDIQVHQIGVIIPPHENHIESYQNKFKDKITITLIKKDKTLYTEFLEAWFSFYDDLMGMKPNHNAADGNHLKKIIRYLKAIEPNDADAMNLWQLILTNWNSLDSFYKNSADLKFISSQINKIFQNVKRINITTANDNGDFR